MVTTGMSDAANKKLLEATVYKKLQELGWTIGQNLIIEYRSTEGHYERFPHLFQELVRLKVDVLFTGGGVFPLDAARKSTTTIAIVMAGGYSDPVGAGVITSLARPGGNVTGTAFTSSELPGKRLQFLKQLFPALARVGLLTEPGGALQGSQFALLSTAARLLNLDEITRFYARQPDEFDAAVQGAKAAGIEALLVSGTTLFSGQYLDRVVQAVNQHKLASMGYWNYMADGGLLMGYSASILDLYTGAAVYIDKIFRGAHPSDLPVEEPSRYYLSINLKTAKLIGTTIPQALLLRADNVIE